MIQPKSTPTALTVADLLDRFDGIPPERIRLQPPPGTAKERDVVRIHDREDRLCELVDGVLVEKTVGFYESHLAFGIGRLLANFVEKHDLGIVAGEGGMVRLARGLVRVPDAAFISWDRLPDRQIPRKPIPNLAPDLAVEVLSKGNTRKEMDRKLRDYFATGVRLVWYVSPKRRTVQVYTSPEDMTLLRENDTVDGGDVLPGFSTSLRELLEPTPRSPRSRR